MPIVFLTEIFKFIIQFSSLQSWTSLCGSDWDPRKKYFDIGMVWDNQLGIMGSQNIRFKKNADIQAPFYHLN